MDILFVSDYVCPYCLVAKEALRQALEVTGIDANIRWQPHELTLEPNERVDTYHDAHRKAGYQILVEPCRELGLDMKLPPKVIPRPYTRLAFEGWYYAQEHGLGEAYNELMYRAYFTEERDIGDPEALKELAVRVGLDGDDFAAALESGRYTAQERQAVTFSREQLQVKHVPTIYIDGNEVSVNEYTRREMIQLLLSGQSNGEGFSCGEGGC